MDGWWEVEGDGRTGREMEGGRRERVMEGHGGGGTWMEGGRRRAVDGWSEEEGEAT